MKWYLKVLKNYGVFNGRARRTEYWMFTLYSVILSLIFTLVDYIIGTNNIVSNQGLLSGLYSLFVFIPSIAVTVRRLHDINKSGWLIIIPIFLTFVFAFFSAISLSTGDNVSLILIGALILIGVLVWFLILLCTDGTTGENKWGQNPKSGEMVIESTGTLDSDIKM